MFTATHISRLRAWGLRQRVVLGLVLWVLGTGAWAEPVQSLYRPTRNTWVVDVTGTLSDETLAEVDRLGTEVERSGRGQIVVVVVRSTDGRSPRPYATELFNRWGLGHARRDDGALLFIALKDRKAEIILGDGVDTPEDVARSRELMREVIVPAFREGDADRAVTEGAQGLRELLESAPLNQGLGQPLAIEEHPLAGTTAKPGGKESRPAKTKPGGKESRPPERKNKEFLDDEGMYVELSTSSSSEGEDAAAAPPKGAEPLPSSESSSQGKGTSSGPQSGGKLAVSPGAWAVVAGFILLLIVANLLRRRGVACERCGSRNVKVSTSTLLDAGDHHDGLATVTVRCRRCGHESTSARETSSRWHSDSHSHSHGDSHRGSSGGGRSSGGGSGGAW